jgi:DNA polymerase-4/protein ImuB
MDILCILIPHFAFECTVLTGKVCREQKAGLVYSIDSQKYLLDYTPALEGLKKDMPLGQALSHHPDMQVMKADIPEYNRMFEGVLDSLEYFSPFIEGNGIGEVYADSSGLEKLYGGRAALLEQARMAVPEVFGIRLGLGKSKFEARIAALYAEDATYYLSGRLSGDFFKKLPCHILPVSLKSRQMLKAFGLDTLAKIAELSLSQLQAQFGTEGQRIWGLCRGQDSSPFCPRIKQECIEESTSLPSPTVSLEVLFMTAEALLGKAFTRLGESRLGVRCITLSTVGWRGESWEQEINFKEPALNQTAIIRRVRQVLENCQQPGPVEQVSLRLSRLSYPVGWQGSIFTEVRSGEKLVDNIRQMEMRFGTPKVFKVKEMEPWSRIPERRYALVPLNQ